MKSLLIIFFQLLGYFAHSQCLEGKMIPPKIKYDFPTKPFRSQLQFLDSLEKDTISYEIYDKSSNVIYRKNFIKNNKWDKTYYYYLDGKKVQEKFISNHLSNDSIITIFNYNKQDQLITATTFDHVRRIKEDVYHDWISDEDLEKEKTWAKTGVKEFTYDSLNRLIEIFEPFRDCAIYNKSTWKYDLKNRIIEEAVYYFDKILSKSTYDYKLNSFTETRIDFNNNGKPENTADESEIKFVTYKLDSNGNDIEVGF